MPAFYSAPCKRAKYLNKHAYDVICDYGGQRWAVCLHAEDPMYSDVLNFATTKLYLSFIDKKDGKLHKTPCRAVDQSGRWFSVTACMLLPPNHEIPKDEIARREQRYEDESQKLIETSWKVEKYHNEQRERLRKERADAKQRELNRIHARPPVYHKTADGRYVPEVYHEPERIKPQPPKQTMKQDGLVRNESGKWCNKPRQVFIP